MRENLDSAYSSDRVRRFDMSDCIRLDDDDSHLPDG